MWMEVFLSSLTLGNSNVDGGVSVIFNFTTPNTDLQSVLVFVVLPHRYVTDAGGTFERHCLSARGNIVGLSVDGLTLRTLLFKVPRQVP